MQSRRSRLLARAFISLGVFLLFSAHSSGWLPLRLLSQLERYAYDARMLLTLPGGIDSRVVIIDIDEKSLAAEGHFPWSRDKLAELVTQLFERYHVGVLGLDYVFPEADRSPSLELLEELSALPGARQKLAELAPSLDTDGQFAAAIAKYPVVTGFVFEPGEAVRKGALPAPALTARAAAAYRIDFIKPAGYVANLARLQQGAAAGGFFDNPVIDPDGIFRRVPLLQQFDGAVYASLPLAIVRQLFGNPAIEFTFDPPQARDSLSLETLRVGPIGVPIDGEAAVMIPYRGPLRSFPYISATDVMHGAADPKVLKPGVIALMGTSVAGLYDLRATPVGKAFVGVEIHANLVAGMLEGSVRRFPPYYVGMEVLTLLAITIVLTIVLGRFGPLVGAICALAMGAAVLVLALAQWQYQKLVVPLGVPLVFILVLFLAQTLYGYFMETRRSLSLTRQFGEYVPPEIVAEMAENPGMASMEGESREMTVLFSDVRGFTTIAEALEPKELTQLMNHFLTAQTKVIQRLRGTIDKYIGDAVMAFWGAPLPDAGHAVHGLQAALGMIGAIEALDAEFEARGWPKLRIGVGVNTGRMNVGNMGSEFRRAYTVMGDVVNLGSRLEAATREYGVNVICGEATRQAAPDWSYRELDLVRVKGKTQPVAIFEPLGPKDSVSEPVKEELVRHRAALRAYRAQDWDKAEAEFFGLSQSGSPLRVYSLFLERIAFLRQNPPGAEWDGAFTFTHK